MTGFVSRFLQATAAEAALLFGAHAAFLWLMRRLDRIQARLLCRMFPGKSVPELRLAWIGVPIHELSHAFMAVAFRHKLRAIKAFDADGDGGTLGYVTHQYDATSPAQVLGNAFIAMAPLWCGSILVVAILLASPIGPTFRKMLSEIFGYYASKGSSALGLCATLTYAAKMTLETLLRIRAKDVFPLIIVAILHYAVMSHFIPSTQDIAALKECLSVLGEKIIVTALAIAICVSAWDGAFLMFIRTARAACGLIVLLYTIVTIEYLLLIIIIGAAALAKMALGGSSHRL